MNYTRFGNEVLFGPSKGSNLRKAGNVLLFSRKKGLGRRRKEIPLGNSTYGYRHQGMKYRRATGRRPYAGYRSGRANRVVSRKRRRTRYRRRKLRWGTRVRKQALGLFEGKRFGVTSSNTTVLTNIVKRHLPMSGMITSVLAGVGSTQGGVNTIARATRVGMKIHLRGIKTTVHLVNNSTTAPVDIRIIAGWRKRSAYGEVFTGTGSEALAIFRNKETQKQNVVITSTNEGLNMACETIGAPLTSSKYFHCAKDMVVRLGPSSAGDTSEGSGFRLVKLWWEMNNRINTIMKDDITDSGENVLDFFPVYIIFGINPSDHNGDGADFTAEWHSVTYWKDPIG